MTTASEIDLVAINANFENAPAEDVVAWAHETFGEKLVTLCAMTSDTALVDLLSRRAAGARVVFLETGHHFAETLEQVAAVHARYEANVNFSTATSGLAPGTLWCTRTRASPLGESTISKAEVSRMRPTSAALYFRPMSCLTA